MDVVVSVYDARGRQLANNRDGLRRDALVDFTTPAAGDYFIKVHDAAFQAGPNFYYRLHVGVLPVIDFVFPPAGLAGGNRPLTIFGRNLPGGQPAGFNIDGRPLQKLAVNVPVPGGAAAQSVKFDSLLTPAAAGIDATQYRVKGPAGTSNPVLVGIATAPPVNEAEPNNSPTQPQRINVPCEVMARFDGQRDRDWFEFEAKQGEQYSIEVISQRMGVHTHPSLMVERIVKPAEGDQPEQTQQLAYVFETADSEGGPEFDLRNDDPVFNFTAAADGVHRVLVRDAYSDVKPDPRAVYRLAIRTGGADFRLAAVADGSHSAVLLRKGGQVAIRVVAFRRNGFDGPIEVSATGLSAGVTATTGTIGPASNHTMIVLTAAANAKPATGLIQVTGKAKVGTADVTRTAQFGTALAKTAARQNSNQIPAAVDGRISRNLAVSISAEETSPITGFTAGDGKVIELPRGGKVKIPTARAGAFKGRINFIPRGLPANITAPAGAINANQNAGEFEITLRNTTPTGTYTFYLDAVAEQVDYTHNPEAATAAAERKKEVDALKAKADADAKAASDTKATADKAAADAATAVAQATTAKAAADTALGAANTAAEAAATNAANTKKSAAANPADENLKTAVAMAQKAAEAANAKAAAANEDVAAAQKSLDEATAKAKAADEAKVLADEQAAKATELAAQAAALKTATDKLATDTANAAKAKKVNVPIVSTPVTIKITPAPITLAPPSAAALKQGAMAEVPLAITRLYDFNDQVNLQVVIPSGVAGISIPNTNVPANMSAGKVQISAAANATVGQHQLIVRATMSLNGQALTVEQPLQVTIAKADPAPAETSE